MPYKRFRSIKFEIRVLGVDDGVFIPHSKGLVDVVGVVFRGGYWLDGVMRTEIEVDGLDATEKIASMIIESPHYKQLRIIMLSGITFAGFNVVDIKELYSRTELPVIALTRDLPKMEEIKQALENLPEKEKRWKAILNAGEIIEVQTREGEEPIYMQIAGLERRDAEKIVRITSTRSNIPEPLRVAHIIASGLTKIH
ncbi:hypothetical protein DRO19_03915 [Candidatus Bathyarchaeota archaeon]|nr:MAG: hypothetical protein DRO19_03915 [Candidatus Bathyarchaeota archaeon]